MQITTKFELKQIVWLNDLRCPAKVVGFFVGLSKELQYEVRWFNGHDSKSGYFYEEEIGIPPENEIGFKAKNANN